MSTCPKFQHLLVLPNLQVQNANAISSPLTHGFPSITAFLGLMWALQRKIHAFMDIEFKAVGVVCHDYQELTFRISHRQPSVRDSHKVNLFSLTRNPVKKGGEPASIVEEGRIHLKISLVLAVTSNRWSEDPASQQADIDKVTELLSSMRIAGGTLLPPVQPEHPRYRPWVINLTGTEEDRVKVFKKSRIRLLPGFTLVLRSDLIKTRLLKIKREKPEATLLDAWLSLSRFNWEYHPNETEKEKGAWKHDKEGKGWIVPISIGYTALHTELHKAGTVVGARDTTTPFRFTESIYSIGEWVGLNRLHTPDQFLWYSDTSHDQQVYSCRNDYAYDKDDDDLGYSYDDFD